MSANAKPPATEVSFAATAPFARAFGEKEAAEQQAKFSGKPAKNPLLPAADDDMFVSVAFVAGVITGMALGVAIGIKLA